jgi:hypothetical protein
MKKGEPLKALTFYFYPFTFALVYLPGAGLSGIFSSRIAVWKNERGHDGRGLLHVVGLDAIEHVHV